jgi:crossover junction endodeoxyribonuclease RuvC
VRVCGIDPGINGAVGLLQERRFIAAHDMPTMEKHKNEKRQVDGERLAYILTTWKPDVVVIERVQASPTYGGIPKFCPACQRPKNLMAPSAAFNFGDNFGVVKGVVQALGYSLTNEKMILIGPRIWKGRAALIRLEKEDSRTLALRLFPEAADKLARKKDEARAEALLIAFYGAGSVVELPAASGSRRKEKAGQVPLAGLES